MSGFSTSVSTSRRQPLAACVASLFALSAPASVIAANTWIVDNCSEGSSGDLGTRHGTLRFAVINAASGDTVDASSLNCPGSKISLTTGAIGVGITVQPKDSLTILGPGADVLTIDASLLPCPTYCYNRVFSHYGSGTLTISNLGLSGGLDRHYSLEGKGGCVYSSGSVSLDHVNLSSCAAYSQSKAANGGCVFAKGDVGLSHVNASSCSAFSHSTSASGGGVYATGTLELKYSTLTGNTATSLVKGVSGGGARVGGSLISRYSTIDGNSVIAPPHASSLLSYKYARGGGVSVAGNVTLLRTTISNNHSSGSFAGLDAFNLAPSGNTINLAASTISGNDAANFVGGVYSNAGTVHLYNTTIAFNTAGLGRYGTPPNYKFFAAGLTVSAEASAVSVAMQSSIVANNSYGGFGSSDLSTEYTTALRPVTFDAASANNLVRATILANYTSGFPVGTLAGCPLLGTLRNNGGLTKTHALLSNSPAIDHGNNAINEPPHPVSDLWLEDQRGNSLTDVVPYLYPRKSKGTADIGAYEVNQDEIVFNTAFEDCPILE